MTANKLAAGSPAWATWQGLLLAFLAREHVLLAGPVGSAKQLGACQI